MIIIMMMSPRSPSQRYRNVLMMTTTTMMMMMMMMMIVSAWECPSSSRIPIVTHSSSSSSSSVQQQRYIYHHHHSHPHASQNRGSMVNTRIHLFKSPSTIVESTTPEVLVSIPSLKKIIPQRILQNSILFRPFFIRRPGINISNTTTTTGSSSNMDHTPSFISSLTTDKFVMIHRMDDDKKNDKKNIPRMEDFYTTESILPKWMMMRQQQSPTTTLTLQSTIPKEKEEEKEKDLPQQHIGSLHSSSSSSSFKIQMTEEEKQKFLNASLQSYNIHIPSLLLFCTNRMVDVVANNTVMEKKGMTMTMTHHDVRHDNRGSPVTTTTTTTVTAATTLTQSQQQQQQPTKESLQPPPTMMNQNELEQQWIDRMLNRNSLPVVTNNNNINQHGIINQPVLSPSMRWNDAGRLPTTTTTTTTGTTIMTVNTTSSKSTKDIYWENRKAIDMVQQRLIHMTMKSSSGKGSQAIDSVGAIPISYPTTNITIPISNKNRSFIQQDQPRWRNNTIRDDSIPHTKVVVPTIITPMRIEIDQVTAVPSSPINNNSNRNTMNHEFQRRKPQPSIPSSTLSNQKKKIRMEIPTMEQQQPDDESKDMSNPNNLHDVRRPTTTPTNKNNDPNDVVTPTTTKQQLDRAKMWGIDMSKFQ